MAYDHPDRDPNLVNLVRAMDYNTAGQPIIRTVGQSAVFNNTGNTNTGIDAFGRLRTSEPFTTFDNSFRYSDNTLEWDTSISGSAQKNHLPSEASISMFCTTASGDAVIRETKKVFQYQPGKSLLIMNTFVFAEGKTNLRQRVGYYGAENGIFLELNETTLNIVKRSSITSSVDDTKIPQQSWNIDPLDGTGPSGVLLDITKAQILWTDMEWLGVGSVRVGFVINGQFIPVHIFHHANIIDSVYMTTASLPIRYEITNLDSTSSTSTMKQICSTVISEGGFTPRVHPRAASTAITGLALSDTNFKPLVALRLKSDKPDAIAIPLTADLYGLQQAAFKFRIYNGSTVSGGTWVSPGAESTVEYNVTATNNITDGNVLLEGIFVGDNKGGANRVDLKDMNHSLQLRRNISGTAENFVVAALATTNNDDAVGSLTWQEFN